MLIDRILSGILNQYRISFDQGVGLTSERVELSMRHFTIREDAPGHPGVMPASQWTERNFRPFAMPVFTSQI